MAERGEAGEGPRELGLAHGRAPQGRPTHVEGPRTAARRRPRASLPAARMSSVQALPSRVKEAEASLIGAIVGPHLLAFDLRSLRHIESDGQGRDMSALRPIGEEASPSAFPGAIVDLRVAFGVASDSPGQTLLCAQGAGTTRVVVDAGLRLLRVPLDRVHPLPEVLRRLPGLDLVGALIETDDGVLAWLIDTARLPITGGP